MKKKFVVMLSIVLVLLLGAISLCVKTSNKIEDLTGLLEKKHYSQATELLRTDFMKLPIVEKRAQTIVVKKIETYRIDGLEDFLAIKGFQWGEIYQLYCMVGNVGWDIKSPEFIYITKLAALQGYYEKAPALRWMESYGYDEWHAILSGSNIELVVEQLKAYSFQRYSNDGYTSDCKYISQMTDLKAQLADAFEEILWYANAGDSNGLYWAKQDAYEVLAKLQDVETQILLEKAAIEGKIAELTEK